MCTPAGWGSGSSRQAGLSTVLMESECGSLPMPRLLIAWSLCFQKLQQALNSLREGLNCQAPHHFWWSDDRQMCTPAGWGSGSSRQAGLSTVQILWNLSVALCLCPTCLLLGVCVSKKKLQQALKSLREGLNCQAPAIHGGVMVRRRVRLAGSVVVAGGAEHSSNYF
jgi:hypothetical protein